jgi:hypothetical protein
LASDALGHGNTGEEQGSDHGYDESDSSAFRIAGLHAYLTLLFEGSAAAGHLLRADLVILPVWNLCHVVRIWLLGAGE